MKGFTLVEMLAALFVFGLLTAAGTLVMGSTLDGQAAVRARMERLGDLQRTRAMLKADLGQLAPRRIRGQSGSPAAVFLGRSPTPGAPFLAFTRRGWENPDAAPRASLQYVQYRLVEDRLERVTFPRLDGAAPGEAQVLIDGVKSARVEFLSGGAWAPVWAPVQGADYPRAVRVSLVIDRLGGFDQLFLTPGGLR